MKNFQKTSDFINDSIKASGIKRIITTAIKRYTSEEVEALIDSIKKLGFLRINSFRNFSFLFLITKWFRKKIHSFRMLRKK